MRLNNRKLDNKQTWQINLNTNDHSIHSSIYYSASPHPALSLVS
jgi:hypothetical protein